MSDVPHWFLFSWWDNFERFELEGWNFVWGFIIKIYSINEPKEKFQPAQPPYPLPKRSRSDDFYNFCSISIKCGMEVTNGGITVRIEIGFTSRAAGLVAVMFFRYSNLSQRPKKYPRNRGKAEFSEKSRCIEGVCLNNRLKIFNFCFILKSLYMTKCFIAWLIDWLIDRLIVLSTFIK